MGRGGALIDTNKEQFSTSLDTLHRSFQPLKVVERVLTLPARPIAAQEQERMFTSKNRDSIVLDSDARENHNLKTFTKKAIMTPPAHEECLTCDTVRGTQPPSLVRGYPHGSN